MNWRAFPLHPETPEDGISLEQLFANTTINIPQMLLHLGNVAKSLGLPFGERKYTYNSRLAQELGLWAEAQGKGHEFHREAFHSYFADGRNLARKDVLISLAEKAGLEKDAAEKVITERTYSDNVDADWQYSRDNSVTAVPTFMIHGRTLSGAQPFSDLLRFIEQTLGKTLKKR